jgi:plastocyanin
MNKSALPENLGRNTKLVFSRSTWFPVLLRWALLLAVLIVPQAVRAQWHATVGAQSGDKGHQALAFLPNEIWIHTGDSITWRFDVDEIHTVTFLNDTDTRPVFSVGPSNGFSSGSASFDGSTSISTPPLANGATFIVTFPNPGNFKLVCLVHENMTGVVHVLEASQQLPHNQDFYDRQAADQRRELLADRDGGGFDPSHRQHGDHAAHHSNDAHLVTAGIGEISATAGGSQTLSVMRFKDDNIFIRAGQTVEWDNHDPVTPHTITFGIEPAEQDLVSPSKNVSTDADGARHAIIKSSADNVHSGFIIAPPQERIGLAQSPLGVTRFRVTFPNAGWFPYICALHDNLGMKGTVIVFP